MNKSHVVGLDVVRSIAIVLVLLAHYFPTVFPNGIYGVDVFFVLSGYVIARSYSNPEKSSFVAFLTNFYSKRIRRLVPALIVCIVLMTLAFSLVATRPDPQIFKTGAYSLVGLSNIYLSKIGQNYFSIDASLNPFTHTWSLGIEEQFYIVFPLVYYWFFSKGRLNVISKLAFGIIVISSLIFDCYQTYITGSSNYYLPQFRIWELGLGVLLYTKRDSIRLSVRIRTVTFLMLFVVLSLPFIAASLSRPIVILTSALMILRFEVIDYSGPKTIPLWLAKLSYGAYLYHWPLLVIAKYSIGTSTTINIVLIVVTLLLAFISSITVERTIANLKLGVPLAISGFALSIFTCAFLIKASSRLSRDFNSVVAVFFRVKPAPTMEPYPCSSETDSIVSQCLKPNRTSSKPNSIFILGDSHAGTWYAPLTRRVTDTKYNVRILNTSQHWGPPGMLKNPADNNGLRFVIDNCNKGDVLMIAFHRGHLNKISNNHIPMSQFPTPTQNLVTMQISLIELLSDFTKKGGIVLLIRDTPLLSAIMTAPTCALQNKISGHSQCEVNKPQDVHTRWLQDNLIDSVISGVKTNISYWDPLDHCYDKRGLFDAVDSNGNYTMCDWNHISPALAEELSFKLYDHLTKNSVHTR
jgi:peptidoglycan/LPS O-acetylase OafA/YrhL